MFLGIDLGTSEGKVLLIDESGAVAGSAGSPLEVQRPHPRWSEQSPEAWWQGTLSAVEGLRRAHPERLATVLLPKDYLRLRLTGEKVSDMSDAAGTLWLDVARRDWSDVMLEGCRLP